MERNGDYTEKWSHCVPFVFNKLRDKKHLIFKVFIWLTYVDCNDSWIFSTDFRRQYSDIKFHENQSVGAEFLCVAGWTDRHAEPNIRFSQNSEKRLKTTGHLNLTVYFISIRQTKFWIVITDRAFIDLLRKLQRIPSIHKNIWALH
jgi:hypothetical protein